MNTSQEFRLPDLGEGLTDAELVSWAVAVGDVVALNQNIAEVETAKALVELPSPYVGTVTELLAEPYIKGRELTVATELGLGLRRGSEEGHCGCCVLSGVVN